MIRIDRIWLAVDPMDMRAGLDTTLARVVGRFGATHPCLCQPPHYPQLIDEQASALVQGLPWQLLGNAGVIDYI